MWILTGAAKGNNPRSEHLPTSGKIRSGEIPGREPPAGSVGMGVWVREESVSRTGVGGCECFCDGWDDIQCFEDFAGGWEGRGEVYAWSGQSSCFGWGEAASEESEA